MIRSLAVAALLAAALGSARADAVATLKQFVEGVKTGRADFTQTVTSPDGAKKKTSSGTFDFSRPDRFRFAYAKPYEQLIVADGRKVWIYDADLNQVTARKFTQALGATPAAVLAGGNLEKDFELTALPAKDGLEWAQATPRAKDGAFQSVRIGFKGRDLAAIEITDSFGQRSLLQFTQFEPNARIAADAFKFVAPKGADVIEQ